MATPRSKDRVRVALMKAEHRKELQTNTLADHIGKFIQGLKEKPGQTNYIILGFVVLAAGSIIAWLYFRSERAKSNSAQWEQVAEATDAEDLQALIDKHKDTPAGREARLMRARTDMAQGLAALYTFDPLQKDDSAAPKKANPRETQQIGRTEAAAKLNAAVKQFEELAPEFGDVPLLAQQCYLNAATIQVTLGNYEEGLKLYHELAKKYPKSKNGEQAEKLAKKLEEDREPMATFYKEIALPAAPHPPIGSGG